jgi:acyl transferase domain-containing protein/acyl carrier protein
MSRDEGEPVAIVGLGCRFPGAEGPAAFWSLIERGGDAVGGLPPDRQVAGTQATRGGFLERVDYFDARFFGISPREAERLDPQQRLLLEVAFEALDDAGLSSRELDGSTAGVFVGMWINDYESRMFAETGRVDFHMTTGSGRYTASGRVSQVLGLRGPSLTVDTACSSSLVAVHLACQSLWSGESDIAIAAGVNVILQPHITAAYSQAGMLSAAGRCKFGDASADGYVRSEGVGVVVLKRLSRAQTDRDPVHAVILGSAVNNDGNTGGSLGTPGRAGQEDLLRKAYRRARVPAASVGYVEAHGTGTRAGDPVELGAIGAVMGEKRPADQPCLVGSVKTNIGHTEGAAGIAGLIKVALSLQHGIIPASLHCETPTPEVAWETMRLKIATSATPWPPGFRRIAGVSSFGIGGTNAHVVLAATDDAPGPRGSRPSRRVAPGPETLLPLSARSVEALREQARRYAEYVTGAAAASLADIAYTAAMRRTHHSHRLAVVGRDRVQIGQRLAAFAETGSSVGVIQGADAGASRIVFVFSGQGSQWVGMGRGLLEAEPAFREAIIRCDRVITPLTGWSLLAALRRDDLAPERIEVIQPTLFAIQVALVDQWRAWGIEPRAVVGHSMGEVAAAHVAGALDLEDAARIICGRSRLLATISGGGGMAVVELSAAEVGARLRGRDDRLSIAVCNSERSTVVAGEVAELDALLVELERAGVFCRRVKVAVASHSPQVEPLRADLLSALRGIRPGPARIPMYSTVTGELIDGRELGPDYWMRNLRETVQFGAAMRRALKDGADTVVEISPHPILLPAIEPSEAGSHPRCVPSMRREGAEREGMLESLGSLFTQGYPVDWAPLVSGACVTLPAYPWQRERFWYPVSPTATRRHFADGCHPMLDEHIVSAADPGIHFWQGRLDSARTPWLLEHRVQGAPVLPASALVEMVLHGAATVFGERACVLDALRLERALAIREDRPAIVQLVISTTLPGMASFRLASREAERGSGAPWVVHAVGSVRTREVTANGQQVEGSDGYDGEPGDRHYEATRRRGLDYGPAFQGVSSISRRGAAIVTRVRTTQAVRDDGDAYRIHPALLDACFQGALAGLPGGKARERATFVPVQIDRLALHGRVSATDSLQCRISPRPGAGSSDEVIFDIDAVDDTGRLVLEVSGLRFEPLTNVGRPGTDRCFFDLEWVRLSPGGDPSQSRSAGTWIVLGDGQVARGLTDRLVARGARCVTSYPVGLADEAMVRGVIDLRGLDVNESSPATTHLAAAPGVLQLIELAKALVASESPTRPRLVIVTAGVHVIGREGGPVSVAQASLGGVGAVIASEHPELRCTRVDLSSRPSSDEIDGLARECEATDGEAQIALRGGDRYVARLIEAGRDEDVGERRQVAAGDTPFGIRVSAVPTIDDVHLAAVARRRPGARQVQIEVRAVGLNFRDVLSTLGSLPGHPDGVGPIGIECSGRVVEVGADALEFSVGDEVVAIAFHCLGTHALADARLMVRKPSALTHEVAASLPIAFVTAKLALQRLAGLSHGDRVLIHAAAGGVGLAAVQLAQHAGATIFATAGSAAKREYLHRAGIEHVLDSRSLAFAGEIGERTRGAGVDVVLNSLAGDAVAAGLSVLGPYGRFVEIGRSDIYRNAPMGLGPFRANLSYSALDLERMCHERPEVVGGLLREVMSQVVSGHLAPLPVTVFPIAQMNDAFRYMAEARHIGKIVLSLSPEEVRTVPIVPDAAAVRSDATYVITGGLGALGVTMAAALVEAGARHLVLIGRRPPGAGARPAITALEQQGAHVRVISGDVSAPAEIERILNDVRRDMPPLRGVIHAAGILSDATVLETTAEGIAAVMDPKAAGAWALHRATVSDPLDFFVLFSSASALLGLPGQASYAAANAFLDGLARHRRQLGQPAISIAWGPWAETGLAAARKDRGERLAGQGLGSLSVAQGVEAFRRVLGRDRAYVAVMDFDPQIWCERQPGASARLFERVQAISPQPAAGWSGNEILRTLRETPAGGRPTMLVEHLRGRVARILRLEPADVPAETPLKSLGLDSLMALELRNRLEADLGLRLSATLVWSHPTISALATHFIEVLALGASVPPAGDAPQAAGPDLSTAEVTALLGEELSRVGRLLAAGPEGHGG